MKNFITSIVMLSICAFGANAQLAVDNTLTVEQYIQNVLLGGGVTIQNVEFNGGPANVQNEQVGELTDPGSNMGFTNGLIMGSGDVTMAEQANTGGGSSLGGPGTMGVDTDLQSITPNQIWDECVIEFDFVPSGDTISFNYVFASEEYEEYVCGSVNDAFGFFLSGNNPAGGTYNATNIALIPDPANPGQYTTTPVSINTVNPGVAGSAGTPGNCDAIDPNWASYNVFYTQNPGNNYEYDGRTVILTAAAAVNCGETYHIKLAIGDGGDNVFDSGVVLEANSFNSSGLSITASVDYVYEGCPGAYYVITRPDSTQFDTISLAIEGGAVNGTDYGYIDTTWVFTNDALTDTIWLDVFSTDGDTNQTDTVEIYINETSACGGPIIIILQADPLEVYINPGDTICTQDPFNESHFLEPFVTGGVPGGYNFGWNTVPPYDWSSGASGQNDSTIIISPDTTTYINVSVTDGCGNGIASQGEIIAVMCPVHAPNIFTPNGDGVNDYFFIENLGQYPQSRLEVYNRWGTLVYENNDYQNNWDGGDVSDGVYFYVLAPNGHTRPQEPFAGTVYITR